MRRQGGVLAEEGLRRRLRRQSTFQVSEDQPQLNQMGDPNPTSTVQPVWRSAAFRTRPQQWRRAFWSPAPKVVTSQISLFKRQQTEEKKNVFNICFCCILYCVLLYLSNPGTKKHQSAYSDWVPQAGCCRPPGGSPCHWADTATSAAGGSSETPGGSRLTQRKSTQWRKSGESSETSRSGYRGLSILRTCRRSG